MTMSSTGGGSTRSGAEAVVGTLHRPVESASGCGRSCLQTEWPLLAISGHLMLELEWLLKAESGLQCQTGAAQDEARWSGFRGRLRFDLQRSYDKRASGQLMTSPSNLDTPSL